MAKQATPDMATIRAAVCGEKWAVEKVFECYSGEIDRLATTEQKQPDGSIKKIIDGDLRQALALKLVEAIPQFPLDKLESEGNSDGDKEP